MKVDENVAVIRIEAEGEYDLGQTMMALATRLGAEFMYAPEIKRPKVVTPEGSIA